MGRTGAAREPDRESGVAVHFRCSSPFTFAVLFVCLFICSQGNLALRLRLGATKGESASGATNTHLCKSRMDTAAQQRLNSPDMKLQYRLWLLQNQWEVANRRPTRLGSSAAAESSRNERVAAAGSARSRCASSVAARTRELLSPNIDTSNAVNKCAKKRGSVTSVRDKIFGDSTKKCRRISYSFNSLRSPQQTVACRELSALQASAVGLSTDAAQILQDDPSAVVGVALAIEQRPVRVSSCSTTAAQLVFSSPVPLSSSGTRSSGSHCSGLD